ncbi:YdgA family protein [Thermomonas sp. HDW16]|nr:YdgA family protein [Thermomonas sp. HDW16]QIL21181.1 YdgA family protein [Thermomonas sp. HDW16]
MKKILVGLALVAILCAVGGAGYRFGQYLADRAAPTGQAGAHT